MQIIYNGANSIYAGKVAWHTNDAFGDLQAHDVGVRSLDLTNGIFVSAGTTVRVSATEVKASTFNDYVCKYGQTTASTCGTIVSITYNPVTNNFSTGNYVRVDRPSGVTAPISCGGDSGGPWYKSGLNLEVTAVGIHGGGVCGHYAYYTPVDAINSNGFTILTSRYPQRYHQNVFFTGGGCTEYRTLYDDNGNKIPPSSTHGCGGGSTAAAPGSGTIETYTAWVVGGHWRESMWRGGIPYTRAVPLNNNGTINWSNPPIWVPCTSASCLANAAPRSQDGYILGNHIYQNVHWTETNCLEYKRALDNDGNPTGTQTSQTCRTTLPQGSSGTITSYTAFVVGGRLYESIWRGGIGYIRNFPLNATNTDANWSSAPAWTQCCSVTITDAQGGDVLSYP